ncbi:MAG TPA: hypothetical protein VNA14_10530 [Mycobacteriales bacterium]|nr:hypothetical protein [Mycobacteriales bacterium]
MRRTAVAISLVVATLGLSAGPALATPVCTDGYMGGAPLAACGNRIFPEAANSQAYIQFRANPTGFREFQHGIEFLAQKYPRWVSVFSLSSKYGDLAKSVGPDGIRPGEDGDTGDGRDIFVVKLTDHELPDTGKESLFFSLSVHGNERGGLEGGMRAVEDLAMAAEGGGTIVDGVDNYTSGTGKAPEFHEYEVADVLAKEAVYFASFNPDGWAVGDIVGGAPLPFARANGAGTDLNRQMPTKGSINLSRNPLTEPEAKYGVKAMHEVAAEGIGKLMAYGADVHGELTSRAYVDIMYPAGQFDSVKHRQLMAIAERTKSVIDETLYAGIQNEIEEATGGNDSEGIEEQIPGFPDEGKNTIPTMPAHWATVWDTLGYTDTGFIGDYLATDLAVTGMDYEIMLNHTVPDKAWNVYLQENHINASRAIIKTAMAYALTQSQDFNDKNVVLDTGGQAGYVVNPVRVTDKDGPGPGFSPEGADGLPVKQAPYDVSNQDWFKDTSRLMPKPFVGLAAADIALNPKALDVLDTLVLADVALPKDAAGRPVDKAKYYANIKSWVERGGNLVLTDRAVHAAGEIGVLPADSIIDETVYQPNATSIDFEHPIAQGLRGNAKQLVEAAILGYGIGGDASPMTVVDSAALTDAGGTVIGNIEKGSGEVTTVASLGELQLGKGLVRLIGGALPMPTEDNDHRYGLRSYGLTYSGLFIMENAVRYDAAGLGVTAPRGFTPTRPAPARPAPREPLPATGSGWEMALVGGAFLIVAARLRRRRALGRAA